VSATLHTRGPCKTEDPDHAATCLITVAGSAGAFQTLRSLVESLPSDLDAALVLMLHTGPGSFLAETLGLQARLRIQVANSGTLLLPGTAYVAPPGAHIVVNPDARLSTSIAGRIRLFRPSADWLFESAAASFGDRHIAVVLSGLLTDGAQQIRAVKRAGGMVLVQSPSDAVYPEMPLAAIATGCVDRLIVAGTLAQALVEIVSARDVAADDRHWSSPFDCPN
jgi:chemotaxis response regulator CheB